MVFEDSKELVYFLKECSKLGITEYKGGDLHIIFGTPPTAWKPTRRTPRNATRAEADILREADEETQKAMEELEMAQLAVDDPLAFENEAIKSFGG